MRKVSFNNDPWDKNFYKPPKDTVKMPLFNESLKGVRDRISRDNGSYEKKLEYFVMVEKLVRRYSDLYRNIEDLFVTHGSMLPFEFKSNSAQFSKIIENIFDVVLPDLENKLYYKVVSAPEYKTSYEELDKLDQLIKFLENEYKNCHELIKEYQRRFQELLDLNSEARNELNLSIRNTRRALSAIITIYSSSSKLKYYEEIRKCEDEIEVNTVATAPLFCRDPKLHGGDVVCRLGEIDNISKRIKIDKKQAIAKFAKIIRKALGFLTYSNLLDEKEKAEIGKKISGNFEDLVEYLRAKNDKQDLPVEEINEEMIFEEDMMDCDSDEKEKLAIPMVHCNGSSPMKGVKKHYKRSRLKKISLKESGEEIKEIKNKKLDAKYGTEIVERNLDNDIWWIIYSMQICRKKKPKPPTLTANDKRLWELYRRDNRSRW